MRALRFGDRSGFAMIEALIAWLVLSVGLLGLSVLFARGLAHTRSALYRTAAVYLTENLAESIRANAAGSQAYDPERYGVGVSQRACAGSSSAASGCTAAELAENDLALAEVSIHAALPGRGQLSVGQTAAAGLDGTSHFRIQVLWQEPDSVEPLIAASDLVLAPAKAAP